MKNNGILDARTLACYIKEYYKTNFKKKIFPHLSYKKLYIFVLLIGVILLDL